MNTLPILESDCRSCFRTTRHEILFHTEDEKEGEFFHEKDTWQVVRCLGCSTISFRHRNDDYENVEEKEYGDVEHAISINVYPGVISNHSPLKSQYYLPILIRNVYQQTLSALSQKSFVLASMGLRACIEAVCNHLKLSGSNLEKRIDQIHKAGYVSNGDKRRLHAIRFLGNDAAHEVKEPEVGDILIALEIIEHLLNTIYILERRARTLETIAETYEEFLKLVRKGAQLHEGGHAVNLVGILGRRRRLVMQNIDSFELQLQQEILNGKVPYLALGPMQKISNKDVQLYEVNPKLAIEKKFPWDIL